MDLEEILNLFDSNWFNHEIFKTHQSKSCSETNPAEAIKENIVEELQISKLPSIHVRSKSDQMSSIENFSSDYLSPDSVLFPPRLQTILSGKEITEEDQFVQQRPPIEEQRRRRPQRTESLRRRRTEKGITKSLSDLEFQELKGFMDLGFEFSEEDINSSLVKIIPGLQRLGNKDEPEKKISVESSVSRPYLSEAWKSLDKTKKKKEKNNPLENWRIPALKNEMDVKDSLKLWAHTVASAIK